MQKAVVILFLIISVLLSACNSDIWGDYDLYSTLSLPQSTPSTTDSIPHSTATRSTNQTPSPSLTATPTLSPTTVFSPTPTGPTSTPPLPRHYYSLSGDSLSAVAAHFGVQPAEITAFVPLPTQGFLDVGTLLLIPDVLSQTPTTPASRIIPDSEVVYSPTAVDFDVAAYIKQMKGKLSTYQGPATTANLTKGAEAVQQAALECSINPRLLLAFIEYYSGWVRGPSKPGINENYPLGYKIPLYEGLYKQLRLLGRDLLAGYYGWRNGQLTELTFADGRTLRLAPDLNAGTVALQYTFSKRLSYEEWLQAIDPQTGFIALYEDMFGDPWERDQNVAPLIPSGLPDPMFILPFEPGVAWYFTNGPHPAWEQEPMLAALDFAPPVPGCSPSDAWVTAIAPGMIVRSGEGYVLLDVDHDGFEQTGWVILYMHIADEGRIPDRTFVDAGARIGHPSCKGGSATGTHVHIARKYNGEWIGAGEPFPFEMDGWIARYGAVPCKGAGYFCEGMLVKGDKVVIASDVGAAESQIVRQAGE